MSNNDKWKVLFESDSRTVADIKNYIMLCMGIYLKTNRTGYKILGEWFKTFILPSGEFNDKHKNIELCKVDNLNNENCQPRNLNCDTAHAKSLNISTNRCEDNSPLLCLPLVFIEAANSNAHERAVVSGVHRTQKAKIIQSKSKKGETLYMPVLSLPREVKEKVTKEEIVLICRAINSHNIRSKGSSLDSDGVTVLEVQEGWFKNEKKNPDSRYYGSKLDLKNDILSKGKKWVQDNHPDVFESMKHSANLLRSNTTTRIINAAFNSPDIQKKYFGGSADTVKAKLEETGHDTSKCSYYMFDGGQQQDQAANRMRRKNETTCPVIASAGGMSKQISSRFTSFWYMYLFYKSFRNDLADCKAPALENKDVRGISAHCFHKKYPNGFKVFPSLHSGVKSQEFTSHPQGRWQVKINSEPLDMLKKNIEAEDVLSILEAVYDLELEDSSKEDVSKLFTKQSFKLLFPSGGSITLKREKPKGSSRDWDSLTPELKEELSKISWE